MPRPLRIVILITLLLGPVAVPPTPARGAEPASPHPVVARIVDEGIQLDEGVRVKVTRPLVTPDMTADEQQAAIEKLVGPGRLKSFMRRSVVAPQKMPRTPGETVLGGAGTVRRIDQYFVAYGDLKSIRDKELMKSFMAKQEKDEPEEEKPFKEYVERVDDPDAEHDVDDQKPYVYRYRFPLLDKVVISGLMRGQSYSTDELLVESAISPAELLDDANDPTVWRPIPRGAEGDADLGPPLPYRGIAGYLQVTDLKFQPGAVLVECHGVLIEPQGWFGGRNLLESKLPLVAQNNVRSFRRKLEAFNKELAAEAEQQ